MKKVMTVPLLALIASAEVEEASSGESSSVYEFPTLSNEFFFLETFQGAKDLSSLGWTLSKAEGYEAQEPVLTDEKSAFTGDNSLLLSKKHVRYGLSKPLPQPFSLDQEEVTIQFEAKFGQKLSCSGAYIKFLSESENKDTKPEDLKESNGYVLMFGPDKCGTNEKLHVIFRHRNPVSGEIEEKHLQTKTKLPRDTTSHVYTLQLQKSDQSVRLLIDGEEKALSFVPKEDSFKPSFLPPAEIDDPEDKKPEDWVDEAKMPDPEDVKPEDWVEEEFKMIVDTEANKPSDWDDEEDGEWEPPMISNPDYKGPWKPHMIDNPEYKGEWSPKKIPNPNYFEQEKPLSTLDKISSVFVEVLVNDEGISFDNIVVASNHAITSEMVNTVWGAKKALESDTALEDRLAKQKKERDRKWEEEFGIYTVVDYAFSEVMDVYERHPILSIGATAGAFIGLFYLTCIKTNPWMLTDSDMEYARGEQAKLDAAKHKKDDDEKVEEEASEDEDDVEEIDADEEEEDNEKESKVRRRPRRAE